MPVLCPNGAQVPWMRDAPSNTRHHAPSPAGGIQAKSASRGVHPGAGVDVRLAENQVQRPAWTHPARARDSVVDREERF